MNNNPLTPLTKCPRCNGQLSTMPAANGGVRQFCLNWFNAKVRCEWVEELIEKVEIIESDLVKAPEPDNKET